MVVSDKSKTKVVEKSSEEKGKEVKQKQNERRKRTNFWIGMRRGV